MELQNKSGRFGFKSAVLRSYAKLLTAYYESGHALCCLHTQKALSVHKATIMPLGPVLFMTMQLSRLRYDIDVTQANAGHAGCVHGWASGRRIILQ